MASSAFISLFLGLGVHPVGVALEGPAMAAFENLRRELDSQQMVWVEGRHLPQRIAPSSAAQGIELVR